MSTWKRIKQLKFNDHDYNNALVYLQLGHLPEIINTPMKKTRYKKKMKDFVVEQDREGTQRIVLHTTEPHPDNLTKEGDIIFDKEYKLTVLRESEIDDFLELHWKNPITGAFRGTGSLYNQISKETIGITRKRIDDFLKNKTINQIKYVVDEKKVIKPIVTELPMNMWHIDLIDIKKMSGNNAKYNWLMVVVDSHSKFAWVEPTHNKSTPVIADTFEQIILREGSPNLLMSDNGNEFVGNEFEALSLKYGIKRSFTKAHEPQTNGCVERLNKTIKNMIFGYMDQYNSKEFVYDIQHFLYAYNTKKHSTTKISPMMAHRRIDRAPDLISMYITKNIEKAGENMMKNNKKQNERMTKRLAVGQKVRVANYVFVEVRKLSDFEKRSKKIKNWSEDIYTINEERLLREHKDDDNETEGKNLNVYQYRLEDEKGEMLLEGQWIRRHFIQPFNDKNLDPRESKSDKEDLRHGVKFSMDKHFSKLGEKAQVLTELEHIDQKDIDIAIAKDLDIIIEESKTKLGDKRGDKRSDKRKSGRATAKPKKYLD